MEMPAFNGIPKLAEIVTINLSSYETLTDVSLVYLIPFYSSSSTVPHVLYLLTMPLRHASTPRLLANKL